MEMSPKGPCCQLSWWRLACGKMCDKPLPVADSICELLMTGNRRLSPRSQETILAATWMSLETFLPGSYCRLWPLWDAWIGSPGQRAQPSHWMSKKPNNYYVKPLDGECVVTQQQKASSALLSIPQTHKLVMRDGWVIGVDIWNKLVTNAQNHVFHNTVPKLS